MTGTQIFFSNVHVCNKSNFNNKKSIKHAALGPSISSLTRGRIPSLTPHHSPLTPVLHTHWPILPPQSRGLEEVVLIFRGESRKWLCYLSLSIHCKVKFPYYIYIKFLFEFTKCRMLCSCHIACLYVEYFKPMDFARV